MLTVLGGAPSAAVSAGRVGYMTQAAALYGDLSVDENLRFFAALQGVAHADERIVEALRTVDLLDRQRSVVNTLSSGMRTRVSLAATLLHRPSLLLLDEPTVGVDPLLRQEFWAYFRKLASSGTTLLVSSHVMDEASRCDRLGLIRAGAVLAEGTANELVARAGTRDLESAFLALATPGTEGRDRAALRRSGLHPARLPRAGPRGVLRLLLHLPAVGRVVPARAHHGNARAAHGDATPPRRARARLSRGLQLLRA